MKRIILNDKTVIEVKYILRRLDVKIAPSNGNPIEGVLESSAMEHKIGENLIKITAMKNILIRRPLINIFINGELHVDSDTHSQHIFKDFSFICILFLTGSLFFLLNSFFKFSQSNYLLGFIKTIAFGWGDGPEIYSFGLTLGLVVFYLLHLKKRSGVWLMCSAILLDSVISMCVGNPNIVIFAIIIRLIVFPNSIYATYLSMKNFR